MSIKNFRRPALRLLGGAAMVLTFAGMAGCGGGKRTPISAGTVSGGLFVLDNTVTGRDASAATLIPLAGATVTLAADDGTNACAAKAGSSVTATTDANGKWTFTVSDSGKYFVQGITKTGYDFAALFTAGTCANRSVTAEVGGSKSPALFPETSTGANATVWNNNAAVVVPATADTGKLLVTSVISDPVSGSATTITGLSVSINTLVHPTGVTGTTIAGVLPGSKTINVSAPSSLTAPTSGSTATITAGVTASVTLTLSRKVASVTITTPTGDLSTGSVFDFDPQCTYTAVTGTTLSNGPIDCPAGTLTFSIGSGLGTFSNDGELTVGTITTAQTATVTITGPAGATLPANPSINLTNCPTGSESVPSNTSFSGCAKVTAISVGGATGTVYQTAAIDLDLTATCTFAKVDNTGTIITGTGAASVDVACPTTGLTFTATGLTIASNKLDLNTAGTAQVSATRSGVTSAAATAIVVAPRLLSGLAASFSSTSSVTSTNVTYGPTPSPATLSITLTCSYNGGTAYAESLNCLTTGQTMDDATITQTGAALNEDTLLSPNNTTGIVTLTMPSTISESGGTITLVAKATPTGGAQLSSNTLTVNAATGPQTCNGETGICVDIAEVTGAAGAASTITLTGANLPTTVNDFKNVVLKVTWTGSHTASAATLGTGWSKFLDQDPAVTANAVTFFLSRDSTNATATSTFGTFSFTPATGTTGTITLSFSAIGSGTSFATSTGGSVTNVTLKNGKLTIQ